MQRLFLPIAIAIYFSLLSTSFAQANHAGLDHINRIVRGAGGVTTSAISTGAIATAAGDVLVNPSGLKIPVSVAATVGRQGIARAVVAALSGPLGVAVTVATLAPLLPRYHACPPGSAEPGAFYCRDASTTGYEPVSTLYRFETALPWVSSISAACSAAAAKYVGTPFAGNPGNPIASIVPKSDGSSNCVIAGTSGSPAPATQPLSVSSGCASGVAPDLTKPVSQRCAVIEPADSLTLAELEPTLQEKMTADYENNRRLYEALKKDQANAEAASRVWPVAQNPVQSDTPVTVTAPPVTSPKVTTKTETLTNPDGTTSTRKTEEQTTYTPTTSGTTVGDTKITLPSQTTITTSTTNNTTNVTTVETTVVNSAPAQPQLEVPNDYAREATLQTVRDAIEAAGAPVLPDQTQVVTDAKSKSDTDLQTLRTGVESGTDADKGRFFSWVWTPPVGTCAAPTGTVGGASFAAWDICPTANNIREVLGWLFAIFAAYQVYGQMFPREG